MRAAANREPTFAQRFRDAVWEASADELSTVELAALLAYADHCRNGGDAAWVAQTRLMQRCKMRSKSTPTRVVASLVQKGWLELLDPSHWRSKQAATYRLCIPTAPLIGAVAADEPPRSAGRSANEPPRSANEPPRSANQTAPLIGANRPAHRGPLSSEGLSIDPREGASSRTAAPRDEPPEEQTPAAAADSAARAAAHAVAAGAKRQAVTISRWKQPPPAEPNAVYDPLATAVRLADESAPFELPRSDEERMAS